MSANIYYDITDNLYGNDDFDLIELQKKMDAECIFNADKDSLVNSTIQDMQKIIGFYQINHLLKKKKRHDMYELILSFETNPLNDVLVAERKQMWKIMNIMAADNRMRKYVIW